MRVKMSINSEEINLFVLFVDHYQKNCAIG